MGSYADLRVNGYLLLTARGFAYPEAMVAFTEADRYFEAAPDEQHIATFGYAVPVRSVRDRLDVMGFTIRSARHEFERAISLRIGELRDMEDTDVSADVSFFEAYTFDRWLDAFRTLKKNDLQSWNLTEQSQAILATDPDLFEFMLHDDAEEPFGFPSRDFRFFFRAALEACDPGETVEYDLTDVLNAGYYAQDAKVADSARDHLIADFPANAPVVVLTEGSTDVAALRLAMSVRAPHLLDYYSFLDFATSSARGGAPVLIDVVKAFIGARIANRTVALFDNDSAAADALRSLTNVTLPPNIRAVRLPSLQPATDYPTIGPSGPANANVNERAGSLELYFGSDVLTRDDGTLTPVHWRGYIDGVGEYQGELMNKRELRTRFEEKARAAIRDATVTDRQDWSGMDAILASLRAAFD